MDVVPGWPERSAEEAKAFVDVVAAAAQQTLDQGACLFATYLQGLRSVSFAGTDEQLNFLLAHEHGTCSEAFDCCG